jgi:flagellar export protein FliJ
MPFRFPLATVLRLRESVQKQEERALQKIVLEMARVARQIDQVTVEIAEACNAEERAMQQPIPASQVQMLVWNKQAAMEKRASLDRNRRTLEQQRDRQLKAYHAAYRNSETLIDLRDSQRDKYEQEIARADQKRMDDIFGARRQRS